MLEKHLIKNIIYTICVFLALNHSPLSASLQKKYDSFAKRHYYISRTSASAQGAIIKIIFTNRGIIQKQYDSVPEYGAILNLNIRHPDDWWFFQKVEMRIGSDQKFYDMKILKEANRMEENYLRSSELLTLIDVFIPNDSLVDIFQAGNVEFRVSFSDTVYHKPATIYLNKKTIKE